MRKNLRFVLVCMTVIIIGSLFACQKDSKMDDKRDKGKIVSTWSNDKWDQAVWQ